MENRQNLKTEEIEILVKKAQDGSSDAFSKLYDIFVDPIYRYIYYRARSSAAEDLTELVFLKVWENIRQYRHGVQRFSSWIFRIAHNVVIDYYRSNHVEEELYENIVDERPESSTPLRTHRSLNRDILYGAMRELKDHYRQVLVLKYINDLSNEEIGEILGRNNAALRILQFRALKSLKNILEKMGINEL